MDTATTHRIDNYRPRFALGDEALASVRQAVALAEPQSPPQASLLCNVGARHAAWAVGESRPVGLRRLFSYACVAASVAAVEAASSVSVSPYRSRLRRLAAAVQGQAPPGGISQRQVIDRPYSAQERSALFVGSAALGEEDAGSFARTMELGVGAGIIGPEASQLTDEHVQSCGETAVVWGPGVGPVAVREPWGSRLLTSVRDRPGEALTTYYTAAGRQRIERGLTAGQGVPALQGRRLRTEWIVESLREGVPVDVMARLAKVKAGSLERYVNLAFAADPEGGIGRRVPCPDISPFAGLAVPAGDEAEGAGASTEEVLSRHLPRDAAVREFWLSPGSDALRAQVARVCSNGAQTKRCLTALFVLLEWALLQPGMRCVPSRLLRETTLGRWAGVLRRRGQAEASVATYVSTLRSVRDGIRSEATTPAAEAAEVPHDAQQISTLFEAAFGHSELPQPQRRFLAAHLCGQLGAGLPTKDLRQARGDDVVEQDGQVLVSVGGPHPRLLPVDEPYGPLMVQLAHEAGDGRLVGGGRDSYPHLLASLEASLPFEFDARRLQASWVAQQVASNADMRWLCRATGRSLASLGPLIDQVAPERSVAEVVAWSASRP